MEGWRAKVLIDGRRDRRLRDQEVVTPPFDFTLPEDNILGSSQRQGRSVADSVDLILRPLRRGPHFIRMISSIPANGQFPAFSQDVTYLLTVRGRRHANRR